jgi:predicted CopG family antitoxin
MPQHPDYRSVGIRNDVYERLIRVTARLSARHTRKLSFSAVIDELIAIYEQPTSSVGDSLAVVTAAADISRELATSIIGQEL